MPPQRTPTLSSSSTRSWRVKSSRLVILLVGLVVIVGVFFGVRQLQIVWGRQRIMAEARALAEVKGKEGQALAYLKQHLEANKDDLEALSLWSDILFRTSQGSPERLGNVVKADEAILRLDPNPNGERAQATRKRLVEAYLIRGPFLPAQEQRYEAAKILVEDLEKRLKTPDPLVLRLHAQVLQRLGGLADEAKLREAASMYEQAQRLDPKDVLGANQMAFLYYFGLHDPVKAVAALEALIQASPTVPAFLAMAEFRGMMSQDHMTAGRQAQALAELAEADASLAKALKAEPKDLMVRITAASSELRKKNPKKAREHLDAVAEADRSDYRYRLSEGILELQENRADEAIESWSRGLMLTGGSDGQLSFRLAYVLLALGRVDEAEALIDQFRRVVGGREPTPEVRYLQAMRLLKLNHPVDAIAELDKARLVVSGSLKPQYFFLLGQCRLATRDTEGAMADFKESMDADPRLPLPRLARARLLEAQDPEEAITELKRGLSVIGDEPSLIGELARMEFRHQARMPANRRSFAELNAIVATAKKVAPGSADLAITQAQQLATQGKPDDAVAVLEKATARDKTDMNLWLARAEQLAMQNKLDEVLMVLDQASDPKAAGDQAPLRILRAKILTVQGRGAEAREGLVRDQELVRPDQRPLLWQELGRLYDIQREPQSARKAYARWAEDLPDDPLPWIQLLELSLNEGTDDARGTADEALAALKRIGGFYSLVGEAIAALRDPILKANVKEDPKALAARLQKADELITEIEKQAPKTRFPHLLRATLMEKKGDLLEAAAALERALPTEGAANLALMRLNRIYTSLKRDDDLKRLRQTYPALGRSQAELYLINGEKDRATTLASQIARDNPESLESRVWEATILNTAGKADQAEKSLADFVAKYPDKLGPRRALMFFQLTRNHRDDAVKTVEEMVAKVKGLDRPEFVWAQSWKAVQEIARADAAYEVALQKWPEDPAVIRDAAEYYELTGRSAKTEQLLRAAMARDAKRERWAARGLALLLANRGQTQAWREAWNLVSSPEKGADTPEERAARAIVLSGNPEPSKQREAVALFRALLNDLPADLPLAATARNFLVKCLLKTGEEEAAVEIASIDAGKPNATAPAVLQMANALIAVGKGDDAAREVDRLEKLAPGDVNVSMARARVLKLQGHPVDAAKLLFDLAAARLDGPNGETVARFIVRGLVEDLKDLDAADAVATILAKKYPQSLGVRAVVLARQGKTKEAMDLYLKVAQTADTPAMLDAVRSALGVADMKRDTATIALADDVVGAARMRDPKSADLAYMAGVVRHYQGRYAEEIGLYEAALETRPDDISFLNNMAWTLSVSLNEPGKGLNKITEAFNKSRNQNPPPQFYDTLGVTLTKLNKIDDAITNLRLAVKERPTGLVYAHLARAYHKKKMLKEFREARDQAKKLGLTAEKIDVDERAELAPLIFGPDA